MPNELTAVFSQLRRLNQPVPKPHRLPTETEVAAAEQKLGVSFHPDFSRYLLEVSDVVFGAFEPVTITAPGAHTDLVTVTEGGQNYWRLPPEYVPICESNSDIYCVLPDGSVVFWPHDGTSNESWSSIADWIGSVWIGEEYG